MSHEIIYDKQFIVAHTVTGNLFVPMIFAGSNNCIQFDKSERGRRERSWFCDTFICGGKRIATADEILAKAQQIRDEYKSRYTGEGEDSDKYDDKSFGYFSSISIGGSTRRTTFGMFKGMYVTGMKKALTVEQLGDEHVQVRIGMYAYDLEKTKAKAAEAGVPWLEDVTAQNTPHLLETIEMFQKTYQDTGFSWYIHFNEWNLERQMKHIRRKYFGTQPSIIQYEPKQQDHYFTVKFYWDGSEHYFVKRSRRGIRYTSYPYRKFATEKEANVLVRRQKGSINLMVERIDSPATFKIPVK
jgi:hypothetical protein